MIVYGGYQDLRGSSNELWTYHFGKYFLSKNIIIIKGGGERERGKGVKTNYHFHYLSSETESWHLLSPKKKKTSDGLPKPSGRHKHSAVLHDGAMWIYGGMTDLQEKGDLWRWDISNFFF